MISIPGCTSLSVCWPEPAELPHARAERGDQEDQCGRDGRRQGAAVRLFGRRRGGGHGHRPTQARVEWVADCQTRRKVGHYLFGESFVQSFAFPKGKPNDDVRNFSFETVSPRLTGCANCSMPVMPIRRRCGRVAEYRLCTLVGLTWRWRR